ncbi:hypothetical protein TYRP_009938 [Tyrophagus putrescentiae]|nr:hypothetical protein TYRP_009938 [Tyrophagus putrescentiae]
MGNKLSRIFSQIGDPKYSPLGQEKTPNETEKDQCQAGEVGYDPNCPEYPAYDPNCCLCRYIEVHYAIPSYSKTWQNMKIIKSMIWDLLKN